MVTKACAAATHGALVYFYSPMDDVVLFHSVSSSVPSVSSGATELSDLLYHLASGPCVQHGPSDDLLFPRIQKLNGRPLHPATLKNRLYKF